MKRILSLILVLLCLTLGWMTTDVQAEGILASGSCGENLTWTLTDDGVLTISGEGAMDNYYGSSVPWYAVRDSITTVKMDDTVEKLSNYSFYNYTNLKRVTLSKGLTEIPYSCFDGCSSLTGITIPEGLTTIGSSAFRNCTSLKTLSLPSTLTDIYSYAFNNCTSLLRISIPASVEYIANYYDYSYGYEDAVFGCCSSLQAITVDANNPKYCSVNGVLMSKDQTMLYAVPGAKAGSFEIPETVTAVAAYAFWGCEKITHVTIPDSVQSIGWYGFADCTALESVDWPESLTEVMDSMFMNCKSLKEFSLEHIEYVGYEVFTGCASLTELRIHKDLVLENNGSYAYYAETFEGCDSLKAIWVEEGHDVLISDDNGVLYKKKRVGYGDDMEKPMLCWLPNAWEGSYTVPDWVGAIEEESMANRPGLTQVFIPAVISELSYSSMENCPNLTRIDVDPNNSSYWSDEEGVLFSGDMATLILYPGGKGGNYEIPDYVLTVGEYAFKNHSRLTGVVIPESVESIGRYAFLNCSNLRSVTFAEDGNLETIGHSVFYNCDSLRRIEIPGTVKEISSSLVAYCDNLAELILNEGITTIKSSFISGDPRLTSITFPSTLTELGTYQFNTCANLKSLVFTGDAPKFQSSTFAQTKLTVYYPGDNATWTQDVMQDYRGEITWKAIEVLDSGKCGQNLNWEKYNSGRLVITGSGAMYDYTEEQPAPWGTDVISLELSAKITAIGDRAFYGCGGLVSVTLPESLKSVGQEAFYATGIQALTVPEKVTALGSNAFGGCESLTDVYFLGACPDMEESFPTTAKFYGSCLLGWSDETMGYEVEVSHNLQVRTVDPTCTEQGYTETSCLDCDVSYTSNEKEALGHREVTDEGYANTCTTDGLTDGSHCNRCGYVFVAQEVLVAPGHVMVDRACQNCDYTEFLARGSCGTDVKWVLEHSGELVISGTGVMTEYYGYYAVPWRSYVDRITSVEVQSGVTSVGAYAFYNCKALTQISLADSVTKVSSYAFYNCSSLKSIDLPDALTDLKQYAFYKCTALMQIDIPDGVASIGDYTFYGCTALTQVEFPEMLETIGTYAFYNCDGLTKLEFTNLTRVNQYAFSCCDGLTRVKFPEGMQTLYSNAFDYCTGLTSANIPASVTTLRNAFTNCDALTLTYAGTLAQWKENKFAAGPTNFEDGFLWASDFNSELTWYIDDTNTMYISGYNSAMPDYSSVSLTPWANYRDYIEHLVIRNKTSVGSSAFAECWNLKTVDLGQIQSVGKNAFYFCTALESAHLTNEGSMITVGDNAFAYCTGLKEVSLPTRITIGSKAFYNCSGLVDIYVAGEQYINSTFTVNSNAFTGVTAKVRYAKGLQPSSYMKQQSYGGKLTWTESANGMCGARAYWKFDEATGKLTITGNGPISYYYAGSVTPWSMFVKDIKTIEISNGITEIPSYTFEYCENVTKVSLPNTLRVLNTNAFNKCASLNNLILPSSLERFPYYRFNDNTALTDVYYLGTAEQLELVENGTLLYKSGSGGLNVNVLLWHESEEPTCTADGVEGYYAFPEGSVYPYYYDEDWSKISGPEVIAALGHYRKTDAGKAPTCTEPGLTESAVCLRCEEILVSQELIPALGHSPETDPAVEPGCETTGLTEGSHCQVCLAVLQAQEVIPAVGHDPVADAAVEPSCTEPGLTAGEHCGSCGSVLVEQEVLPATGHSYEDDICALCGALDPEKLIAAGVLVEDLSWRLDVDGVLTIEGSGYIPDFYDIDNPWMPYALQIKELVLDPAITGIGDYAFTDCIELSKVTFHEGLEYIGWNAFENTALETVAFPASLRDILGYAFADCTKLSDVTFQEGLEYIWDNAFENTALETVAFPASLREIYNYAFASSTKLSNVTFQEGLEYIGYNAFGNTALETVTLPLSLEYLGGKAFANCASLKKITMLHNPEVLWVVSEVFPGTENLTVHCYCDLAEDLWWGESANLNWELEHREYEVFVFDPTCTEYGGTYELCIYCYEDERNYTYDDTREPLGHDVPDRYYTERPTCTEEGTKYGPCKRCWEDVTVTVPATGHSMDEWYTYQEPSCVVDGEKRLECFNCDYYESEVIPAYGEHIYEVTVYPPTCTEQGVTEYWCPRCRDDYCTDFVDPLGHKEYEDGGYEPTCTEYGWEAYRYCSVCGDCLYRGQKIPALGHDFEVTVVDPTCTEMGYTSYICDRCDYDYTDDYEQELGHVEVVDYGMDPTCTEAGMSDGSHCERCNEILAEQYELEALGHKEIVDKAVAPTCTETGLTEGKYCDRCDAVLAEQEEIPALGHETVTVEAEEPTCTETGLTEGTYCTRCEEFLVDQEEVPATGHSPVVRPGKEPTCEDYGWTEGSKCEVCGEILKDQWELGELGHDYVKTVIPATCQSQGYTDYTCSRCGDNYKRDYTNFANHPYGDWEVTLEATCNEPGSKFRVCTYCGFEEIRTIIALGHNWVTAEAVEPTCTKNGLTEGLICDRCGKIDDWNFQQVVPVLGHDYQDGICTRCGDDTAIASGSCGNEVYWTLDENGTLTISGVGYVSGEHSSGSPWHAYQDQILAVDIQEGITRIYCCYFNACKNLKKITIPSSLESSTYSFASSIPLDVYVTDLAWWMDPEQCDWHGARPGGNLYVNGELLTDLVIPEGITEIGEDVFEYNTGLRSVVLPEGVTTLGRYAFYGCSNLESITVPTTIESWGSSTFGECDKLKTIHISDLAAWATIPGNGYWPTDANDSIKDLYLNGELVTDLVIPEGVTAISANAFSRLSLESVELPESLKRIGSYAFYNCDRLASVTMGENVTEIGSNAFYGCGTLGEINLSESLITIGEYAFYYCEAMDLESFPEQLESIGKYAFAYTGLTAVILPDTVTELGNSVFGYCYDLEQASLSAGLTAIPENAFYYCSNLKEIEIPDTVESIGGGAFYRCYVMTLDELPQNLKTIGASAFYDCEGLTDIQIPDSVTEIGNFVFLGCNGLRNVVIGKGIKTLNPKTFSSCGALGSVEFLGDAPYIYDTAFTNVTADAFYPEGNTTWTEKKLLNYGGTLTWHPACPDGHDLGDWEITTPGHCRQDEIETRFCADCDYFITRNNGKGDHIAQTITGSKPGCTYSGATDWERCSICRTTLIQQENIPALGHVEVSIPAVEPTCTNSGLTEGTKCERCNSTLVYQQRIDSLGHDFAGEWITVTLPTCTEPGMEKQECSRCDAEQTRSTSSTGHNYIAEVVSPTCEEEGYTIYTCDACGDEYVADYVEPLYHDLYCEIIPATCEAPGMERTVCRTCGYCDSEIEIPALEHTRNEGELITEPTEESCGEMRYVCTECGHEWIEEVPPLEHTHKYVSEVTEPTCVNQGYTTWTCYCGHSYADEFVSALGHTFKYEVANPTCTTNGYIAYNCYCGFSYVAGTVEALGHSWDEGMITEEPTCEHEGEKTFTCGTCGDIRTVTLSELGHNYIEKVMAPTCEEEGYTDHICSNCDDSYIDSIVAAIGHQWNDGEVTEEPTCTAAGVRTYTCENDPSHQVSEVLPELGHDMVQYEGVEPSCSEFGWTDYEACSRCDYTTYEEIPALGHEFSNWVTMDLPTCTRAGEKRRECAVCDHFESEKLDALGHKEGDGVIENNIEATCTDDGSYELVGYCSVCGEEQSRMYVIAHAVGHKFVNYVSDGNATATQDGTKTAKCENCDATDTIVDEGTKLRNGWVSESGKWYYYAAGQKLVSRWVSSGGKWYYLGQNGVMATGWTSVNGKWYYMDQSGVMQSGWLQLGNNRYYLDQSGVMQTGLKQIDKSYYYFASGGAMQTGWQTISGVKHLFGETGAAVTGWYKDGSVWNYLDNTGAISTGWVKVGSYWYYMNESGVMQTGWVKVGSSWYYMSAGGAMQTGWVQVGGNWYYMSAGGVMQTGWVLVNNTWYYMSAGGAMQTGWVKVGSNWYYMSAGGAMQTGWVKVGNNWYYMNESGVMQTGTQVINGKTYKFSSGGVWVG